MTDKEFQEYSKELVGDMVENLNRNALKGELPPPDVESSQ